MAPTSKTSRLHRQPLPAAPNNVFLHDESSLGAGVRKAWTNYYELPVEYTVELHDNLLSHDNVTLATRFMPSGLNRRFCVIDKEVERLYGERIRAYFEFHSILFTSVIVEGEEENKRYFAAEKIFNALCEFGLLRREPIFVFGGGCVLDIVGFTASTYRRGVPYVRIPTTLLAIVDASVGVKCGVDWVHSSLGGLKNRMGSFYAPICSLIDKSFIATQDKRNLLNGLGEIMKLSLVRSKELFELLENHGTKVVMDRFQCDDGVADKIIELSIEIMLEELGPNLWEFKLERCVDYGHTFSKIIEMRAPIMHGEAVNIDGFFCVVLALNRGWIERKLALRIVGVMHQIGMPLWNDHACVSEALWKGVIDGIEHRHGKLRMPLVKDDIGKYGFVNDVTKDEIDKAIVTVNEILARVHNRKGATQNGELCGQNVGVTLNGCG